ncbi:MAG TPA: hypothetical protein DDW52_17260 [Planctomycetaceae bacterium]|nr:hypothetical protein [Planctomycetaceae bacterium]
MEDNLSLVVPDLSQKIVYSLSPTVMRAMRLNTRTSVAGKRRVELPSGNRIPGDLIKRVERLGDFKIDHPVAFTYADRLEIYLIDGETGVLLRGVTSPITQHGSRTPRTTVSDDLGPLVQGSVNGSTPSDLGVPPERQVIAGKSYEQQLVASKDVRLQLLLAPKGAKLQPNGKIVWQTDEKSIGDHSFKVRVEHPDGQRSFVRFVVKVLDVEVARELAQFGEAGRGLELDGDLQSITYDFKAKRHLVLHGDMLTAIGRDGTKVLGKRKPPSTYSLLRERKAYWVASLAHQPTLVYAHRTTLEPIRKISLHSLSLPVRKIVDIALHPNLPIIYAAVECIDQTPRYVILVVDEAEGEVQRNVLLGNWIKIAPDGVRAYTGYHDLYRTGTDFMIDPNWNILDVPTYGSIDMLMQWQLDGMRAEVVRAVTNPGEGGSGLLLSHDGRRVTFESYGGSPGKKDTLASFNSGLTRAVNFKTDRLGKTLALAYHPFLPIVATLQGDEPKLMNRETAEEIEDALLVTGEMPNLENAIRMFFSPDGQALVFALRQKDGKKLSLRALALKQFVLDMKHLPPPEMPKRKTSTRPKRMAQVRRSDIDAMRGMQTKKELKISEIAKDNLDSVVLITTATGAGTGFCVGDEGYIMTAAHVIPRIGNFKVKITNNNRTQEHIGEVLLWNQELDLALVRIPGGPYQSVRFSKRKTLDTGEEVVVIGNPVTGPKILEKTLTSGVVSNPSVEFDNVSHIQTSAAINPGNSGGPMFDRFGCVIGVVSSKALIEGASFVVPVTTVREYLERNLP